MPLLVFGLLTGLAFVPIVGYFATKFGATGGGLVAICLIAFFVGLGLGFPIHDAFFGNTLKKTESDDDERGRTSDDVVAHETQRPHGHPSKWSTHAPPRHH